MPRRCATVSFAVPMSMPRYSCMASALTISPPSRSASSRPRSDLPVAVGPTTATMGSTGSADQLVGVLVAVALVVAEGVTVDAGVPGVAGLAPAVAPDGLAGLLRLPLVQAVDVEGAVEVVVLVLHAAREPAGRVELHPVAVEGDADDVSLVGALERARLAGHGPAAPGVVVGVRALLGDLRRRDRRVDDVALLGHAVVVGHLP